MSHLSPHTHKFTQQINYIYIYILLTIRSDNKLSLKNFIYSIRNESKAKYLLHMSLSLIIVRLDREFSHSNIIYLINFTNSQSKKLVKYNLCTEILINKVSFTKISLNLCQEMFKNIFFYRK